MKRTWTPALRVWPACLVVAGLTALTLPAFAAPPSCETPEAKINPASLTIADFVPVTGGGWAPNTVTINGQASKPNANQGGLFQWSFVGTAAGTLANANSAQVQFTPPDVSASTQVVLRLTVTVAGCPGSDSEDIPITITNAHDVVVNAPPHAVPAASPAAATEGVLVTLDGSGSSDPENAPLTYVWEQTGGPAVALSSTANPAIRTFVAPNFTATTLLTFRLTVTDPGALAHSDSVFVNVSWTNDAPVAAIVCPNDGFEVNEGQPVTFDARASTDADDGIASYQWEQLVGLPEVPGVATWNTPLVTFNAPQLGFENSGLVPFKLTVADHNGGMATAYCSIFIHDITRPVVSVPASVVAEATSADGANVGADEGYVVSATDIVDGDLPLGSEFFLCEPPPGSLFELDATTPVLCRAWDSAGNEGNASFTVRVLDRTAPVIKVPLSFAVEAIGPDGAPASFDAKSTDAVDGEKNALCVPASGSTFPINSPGPTTTVACNATDAHGNVADEATFTIAVHDTTAPAFDLASVSGDLVAEATAPGGAHVSFASPIATDLVDLGNVVVSCAPASGTQFPLGDTTVSCDAADTRGNRTQDEDPPLTVGFKVTVQDTQPPVFSGVPANQTLEAQSAAGAAFAYPLPLATDVVDGDRPVTCANAPELLVPGVFPLGTTTVSCSASDTRGNSASAAFTVTVVDTTAPVLALPADITAEATGPAGAAVAFTVSASDLVDASVDLVCSANSGATFALGATPVTCTATDDYGNASGGSFTITVVDTTGPEISPHGNLTATATGNSSAVVNYGPLTAYDLVDGAVPVTCEPPSGSSFPVGSTTVECHAYDSRGNGSYRGFTVTVTYSFSGFFQPIDNPPTPNTVKAGSAVPVKFSLGGNQGLDIFQSPPASGVIACGATEGDAIEVTVTAGSSSLQYDPVTGQYIYVWKTEKAWVGQCRILQVKLKDGVTTRSALFKFK